MWNEIGRTLRKAMDGWAATARLVMCLLALSAAGTAILFVSSL